jgi:hypothetical protein
MSDNKPVVSAEERNDVMHSQSVDPPAIGHLGADEGARLYHLALEREKALHDAQEQARNLDARVNQLTRDKERLEKALCQIVAYDANDICPARKHGHTLRSLFCGYCQLAARIEEAGTVLAEVQKSEDSKGKEIETAHVRQLTLAADMLKSTYQAKIDKMASALRLILGKFLADGTPHEPEWEQEGSQSAVSHQWAIEQMHWPQLRDAIEQGRTVLAEVEKSE